MPDLTVAENIFLGHELVHAPASPSAAAAQPRGRASCSPGSATREISPTRAVGSLSPAGQQIVSMARALSHDTRLLIMDEPSAVLDQDEVENLFRVIRDLTAEGVAVVYISHRLEEIRQIGDRITVLKDGRTVGDRPRRSRTRRPRELIRLMTGRSIEYVFPPRPETARDARRAGARGRGPRARRACSPASTSPCAPARSSGSPASSAPAAPRSSRRSTAPAGPRAGTVTVDGKRLRRGSVTARGARRGRPGARGAQEPGAAARRAGLPQHHGLVADAGSPGSGSSTAARERRRAAELTRALDVRPAGVDRAGAHPVRRQPAEGRARPLAAARLPGAAARRADPRRRRRRPHRDLRADPRAGRPGVAVVVVSSEIEEVLGLADRVLVVREGRVVHEGPADEIDEPGSSTW